MKLTKRIVAVVLACVMSLCVLTACGGSSHKSDSVDATGKKVVETLEEKGMTGVTVSEELTKAAKAYAEAQEPYSKIYAETVQAAIKAGEDYDTAEDAAWDKYCDETDKYLPTDAKFYGTQVDKDSSVEEEASYIAGKIVERATEKGWTIKEVGCTTTTEYSCDESGEIAEETWLYVFYYIVK